MPKVAIIGSCITRDLWPIRGETERLLYVSRTSLPSLFSAPVKGVRVAETPPAGLGRHQHRAMVADLEKTALAALIAFRPTHLIFDFIDERFDLISLRGALATHSWELEVSGYLGQKAFAAARRVPRLSPACERLWRHGAAEMAAFVRATPLKDAALILHSARWAEQSRGAKGRPKSLPTPEILPGRPEEIAAHNRLLASYEKDFAALMPPLVRVEAPQHRLADERHRWGLSPFHYVGAYYEEIWRQLEPLGVEREVSGPAGAPSVRAA
ncbi:DUF6270 domain-containing protein [Phenylobacterium sp.]|uniref:DUF6270 domain-containing protein n=1 Tax=Phenylobacterium sp. TaxID=1871053 RepID=UPI002DF55103|nr:DUF6270 domain-containing protein [Phenylobacterium sp.]